MTITVVIPSLERRAAMLRRALASVSAQQLQPADVVVKIDHARDGAPATRQRGLDAVRTPWVAFLDDDDEFKPEHLAALSACAQETGADYVFSWFDVIGGVDPWPERFGRPWNPAEPILTTITVLVRADLARDVGGFIDPDADLRDPGREIADEDWLFVRRVNDAGGRIHHLPRKTWRWYHHGDNTSGLPTR